jgi:hypothetical protein
VHTRVQVDKAGECIDVLGEVTLFRTRSWTLGEVLGGMEYIRFECVKGCRCPPGLVGLLSRSCNLDYLRVSHDNHSMLSTLLHAHASREGYSECR